MARKSKPPAAHTPLCLVDQFREAGEGQPRVYISLRSPYLSYRAVGKFREGLSSTRRDLVNNFAKVNGSSAVWLMKPGARG